ncbi:MAG: radical SAM protein, partial [Planctomycetota bacterium]
MPTTIQPPRVVPLPQWQGAARGGLDLASEPRRLDPSGRRIGYVRLSVTRACSMRCTYCRPAVDCGRGEDEFDAADLAFVVHHLHQRFGLRKVRITGGEPTIR